MQCRNEFINNDFDIGNHFTRNGWRASDKEHPVHHLIGHGKLGKVVDVPIGWMHEDITGEIISGLHFILFKKFDETSLLRFIFTY